MKKLTEEQRLKRNAYMRIWSSKNKDKIKATKLRNITEEKKHRDRERAKRWYVANRERAKEREKERYHKNKILVGRPSGERHHFWRGDSVGYYALHAWVYRKLGKPTHCLACKIQGKKYQWANISGNYKRELSDWFSLCRPCHYQHDKKLGFTSIKRHYGDI